MPNPNRTRTFVVILLVSLPVLLIIAATILLWNEKKQTLDKVPILGDLIYARRHNALYGTYFPALEPGVGLWTLQEGESFLQTRSARMVMEEAQVVGGSPLLVRRLDGTPYDIRRMVVASMSFEDEKGRPQLVRVAFMAELADGTLIAPLKQGGMEVFDGSPEELAAILNEQKGTLLDVSYAYDGQGYLYCNGYEESCAFSSDWAAASRDQLDAFEANGHVPPKGLVLWSEIYHE